MAWYYFRLIGTSSNELVAVSKINDSSVVMQSYVKACDSFGLSNDESARLLGIKRTSFLRRKTNGFDTESKEFELQLLLIEIYRSLFALCGGDKKSIKEWMYDYNHHLNDVPITLCFSLRGIVHVSDYLDTLRQNV